MIKGLLRIILILFCVQGFAQRGNSSPYSSLGIGDEVDAKAAAMAPGDVMLLENLRFHKAEVIKDKAAKEDAQLREAKDEFAKKIADMADVYVCDAFGTAHRDNASMYTVPCMMEGKDRVSGYVPT